MAKGRSYGERSFHPAEEFGGGSVFERVGGAVSEPRLDEQRREVLRSRPRAAFGESRTPKQQTIADAMSDFALAPMVGVPFMDDEIERRLSEPVREPSSEAPRRKAERHQPPSTPKPKPFAPAAAAAGARTWKDRARFAADSMQGKPFFDDGTGLGPVPPKGFRGNVSPVSPNTFGERDSRQQREALREARSASTNKTVVRQSLLDFNGVALGLGKSVEDCVERPIGDYRGPGKWRGAWFNWCKD